MPVDRREAIAEAALDLAAAGGNHAITHSAIDRELALPRGSTSYYFRSRDALVGAALDRLMLRSRAAFTEAIEDDSAPDRVVGNYLIELLADRRRDVLARYALAGDAVRLGHEGVSRCFFSEQAAVGLFPGADDPAAAARDLVTVLEGIIFSYTYGGRQVSDELAAEIASLVSAALKPAP